jgi:hypothetical protein
VVVVGVVGVGVVGGVVVGVGLRLGVVVRGGGGGAARAPVARGGRRGP